MAGSLTTKAQTGELRADSDAIFNDLNKVRSKNAYPEVIGSPYLFDEWLPATVFLKNGHTLTNKLLNIDLYKQEVIWLNAELLIEIDKITIQQVLFQNDSLKINFKLDIPSFSNDLLQELVYDSLCLYKRTKKSIIPADGFGKQPEFKTNQSWFLLYGNKSIALRNFGTVMQLLPQHQKQINEFIKSNDLRPRNEAHMIALILFCNKLLKN